MQGERLILAGGSGFIGSALAANLTARNCDVVVLTRNPARRDGPIKDVYWDGRTLGPWADYLNGARAVVNLTGRSVNCRHTAKNRREIQESRVNSVTVVGEAIRRCQRPPQVLVQASSLAIYGDPGERICDESAPPGQGFAEETCLLWEKAFNEAPTPDTRRVVLRIGFALGATGGALGVLATLTRYFLGGRVGSGRQYISWLHIEDLNRMILWAIERPDVQGVFNATAPEPVTNAEFMRELRRVLHRPWSPPAPTWTVVIGSWLMRTEPSLALTGRRCVPRRLQEQGFQFEFSVLRRALEDLFRESPLPSLSETTSASTRARS
jgi:uncharacterized protein (TIGR01777 family)